MLLCRRIDHSEKIYHEKYSSTTDLFNYEMPVLILPGLMGTEQGREWYKSIYR